MRLLTHNWTLAKQRKDRLHVKEKGQEQNKMLHKFYRDIFNLYLNDNNDISAFFK